ncbi:MAG: biotin/lipoyl-containing protein, partial [Rhizomicrobium sp.]
MSIDIKVPAMGESVTEATVARWFKKEGDTVTRDEPLVELETDKVTVEVPSPSDGSIESISVPTGATVQVGAILGLIAQGGAKPAAAKPAVAPVAAPVQTKPVTPPAPKAEPAPVMPSVRRIAAETGLQPERVV